MKPTLFARRGILTAPIALAAMSPTLAESTRSPPVLLQAFLETLSAHDLKAFRALYVDEGYIQHQTLVTNAPSVAGGGDAATAYFGKRIEAFPDLKVTCDVSLTEGALICANLIWSGTHSAEYLGVPATGKFVTFNSTDIMKVRDGRFAEHWGTADLYGLTNQLRA